jgi:hypothetical protein
MRRIIQIAVSESTDDMNRIALCDDGSVWEYQWPKVIFENVIVEATETNGSYTTKKNTGTKTKATWERMADIPQDQYE